ncbi:MAG TPA: rhodanese-like domain-containing protein [Sedimentisphaerales bacterium]|nr:rhodanese-like domain-containing protein [Sedimentisphaerales bacterium]
MFVQQFFVKGLAHNSYLLGGSKKCAIVDPRRDVDVYLESARDMGVKITHILETHLHADFVSGHLDLAEKTGATIVAPKSAKCKFEHKAVVEGDRFNIEDMQLKVLDTPGHTPEHITYIVTDRSRGSEPVCIFCGDVLFVGDVGRPDLFPGKAKQLASQLYDNLHQKLLKLPDFCEVYPAHGAGSLCGRAMGAKRTSTIGYERRYNAALQIMDKKKFIESLTTNMPAAPDHFSRCSAINGKGPSLVAKLPRLTAMSPQVFARAAKKPNTIVLDIRDYESFGGQHVPGAFHVDFGGNFATFAGWILPPDKDILLVAATVQQAQDANVWLKRVGLDRAVGFLDGGMFAWSKEGLPTEHIYQIGAPELHEMTKKQRSLALVDVRAIGEYQSNHIKGAVNIPAPELRRRYKELNKNKPVILICSTGHRSSLGASLLKQRGFSELYNVAGGMTGYSAAGFAAECPMCMAPHVPQVRPV